jgi:glyoxylase-like metal-dependent hydrolase (beta-lactamase superfamily II)
MKLHFALGVLALVGCGPRIDPVTVRPRVTPEAPPQIDVRMCWIESAKFGPATASGVVVRHPGGDVLIDAGVSMNFDDEIEVYDRPHRRWYKRLPGLLKPKTAFDTLLSDADVDPNALQWFIPTHPHIDHVGGYVQMPPVPVLLDRSDLETVERARKAVTFEVVPAHAEALSPNITPMRYEPLAYEIYDRSFDLFHDGTVVIVPLHGHTPGSVGVFISKADGTRTFLIGDAANERRAIERLRGRRRSLRRTDSNPAAANRVLAGLHELAEADPSIRIVPAHERAAWKDAFGEPAQTCPRPTYTSDPSPGS